jgi:hypothetical protein
LNKEVSVWFFKDLNQFKIEVIFRRHLADFPEICFEFFVGGT